MPRAARHTPAAVLLLLAILTSGCSRDTVVGPDPNTPNDVRAGRDAELARSESLPGGGWYPMQAGNQWRYRGHSFTEVTMADGTRDTVTDTRFELVIEQLGVTGNQNEYGEKWTETFPNGGSAVTVRPVRQTREGLWRILAYDPLLENQLLAYPLHPGQTWLQGGVGLETRLTVEAHETLRTPAGNLPAWRIRVERALAGPNDTHHVWFGRAGYLQLVSHTEFVQQDGSIVRTDHTHHLESLSLGSSGRFLVGGGSRPAAPLGHAAPVR